MILPAMKCEPIKEYYMTTLESSKELYTNIFEKLDSLYYMGAFNGDEVKKLKGYLRDDVNYNLMRWEVDEEIGYNAMEVDNDSKHSVFQAMMETLTLLSKIVDGGFIDRYDYPYVIEQLCSSIVRNELPLSSDVDEYTEYFNNNSPTAEEDSSY